MNEFVADRSAANRAGIVIFVTFGKYKKQSLSHRERFLAVGAKKFRGVKIPVCFPSHSVLSSFSGISLTFSNQIAASLSLGAR